MNRFLRTPVSTAILAIIACILILPHSASAADATVAVWDVVEIDMKDAATLTNPYVDGLPDDGAPYVRVTFTGVEGAAKGANYAVVGFWDDGGRWLARFAPPLPGVWWYAAASKDRGLAATKGLIIVRPRTGDELAANPTLHGFLRLGQTGPNAGHWFAYADGTPFLWVGDTWWNWTKRGITEASYRKLIDDRAAKGFTVGQLFVAANGWGRQSSLLNPSCDSLDVAHMQFVEGMIRYANERGITVWVHGWWSRAKMNENIPPEKMRRWWRYLVHRLGAYNVIWVIAGEYNMNGYGGFGLDFWKKLGRMVETEDPYERIIGAHPTPPGWSGGKDAPQWSTGEVIHEESWLSYNQSQVGHGKWRNEMIPSVVRADYARTPAKPVVVTEPWYEFILDNPAAVDIRFGAWSAMLSGAAGHSYGGGHVWKAHVPEAPSGKDSWPMDMSFDTNTLDYPGAMGMSHMAAFMRAARWWELAPHPELVGEYSEPYCAAMPGERYVVYLRWGGAATLDLRSASETTSFDVSWFNPRTGEYRQSRPVNGGRVRRFSSPGGSPGSNDWALLVRTASER